MKDQEPITDQESAKCQGTLESGHAALAESMSLGGIAIAAATVRGHRDAMQLAPFKALIAD